MCIMKRYLFPAILIIFIFATLFIVFSQKEKGLYVFGSMLPLSGQVSAYGEMMQRGQLMAVEDIKKQYGDSVKVVFFNTEHLKDVALSRLMEAQNRNIKYFVELFGSDQVEHCLNYAIKNDLFILSGVDTKSELVKKGKGNFARIMPSDADATKEIFVWLEEEGLKNIAILYVNDDWGEGLLNSALYNIESSSLNLIGQFDINRNQQSFSSTVAKIKEKKPDAVCLFIYPDDGGRFIKEAHRQNFAPSFYATENFTGNDMLKTAQNSAIGVRLIVPATSETNISHKQMVTRYIEMYHEKPTIFALKGYDAVFVMYDILKKSGNAHIDSIKHFIKTDYSYSGITGKIRFNKEGEFVPTQYDRLEYVLNNNNIQLVPVK